jgi:hypothetical protein
MERCLYTYVELNHNPQADDKTASLEHIIPYALGGCDLFSIPYCSKKANNDFGRDIDAPFIALPVTGLKRHALGLKSYARIVPDIVFKGDCPELQRSCNIIFPYQGAAYADFGIDVQGSIDIGQITFSGSKDRLRAAVESLIKKATRKGLAVLSQQLESIATFDEMVEAATKATGETLHFRMNFGRDAFFVPWSKGIIKIAFGLGAFSLGSTWAFSPEADILRSCLICDAASFPNKSLRGTTLGRIPPEIARMIDVQPGRHTLAVLPHEDEMVAFISLFGGEMFDAIIHLGNGPANIKKVNDQLPATWKCVFHIDPKTRGFTCETISEVNARFSTDEI